MKKLIKGIIEFRHNVRPEYKETFAKLALTQTPDVLFIGCSDSRVVPNLFASTDPGDLFVVRNIGNLVPPCNTKILQESSKSVAAALEFSLLSLKVAHIVICGHSACGAMTALTRKNLEGFPHLKAWLKYADIKPDMFNDRLELSPNLNEQNRLSQINVLFQIEHLKTYPIVQKRLTEGNLTIHGWWFDIEKADVYAYEESFKQFVVIDDTEADRILEKLQ